MNKTSSMLLTAVAIIAAGGGSAYAGTPEAGAKTTAQRRAVGRSLGLSLAPDGIAAVAAGTGHATRLEFGAPMDNAVQMIRAATGSRPVADSVNRNCGAGATRIVRFGNGLQLLGQEGQFQGWEIAQRGLGTMDGVEVGTTRSQLNQRGAQVQQSSLGTEFTIGDGDAALGGLLSARGVRGRVTTLWAGLTCHME